MIESLRKSEPRFLAFFASCTFGIGFVVGMIVQLFHHVTAALVSSTGRTVVEWGRDSLEMNAAEAASRVATISIVLWLLSWVVFALALIGETRGNDQGMVRVSAGTLYVLSFIAVIASISAAVFFMMLHM